MNTSKQYRVSNVTFQSDGEPYKLDKQDNFYVINGVISWLYAGENYEIKGTFAIDIANRITLGFFTPVKRRYKTVTYQLKNLCLL